MEGNPADLHTEADDPTEDRCLAATQDWINLHKGRDRWLRSSHQHECTEQPATDGSHPASIRRRSDAQPVHSRRERLRSGDRARNHMEIDDINHEAVVHLTKRLAASESFQMLHQEAAQAAITSALKEKQAHEALL